MQNNYKFNVKDIVYNDNKAWTIKERYILNDVNHYECFRVEPIDEDGTVRKIFLYEKTFRENDIDPVVVPF